MNFVMTEEHYMDYVQNVIREIYDKYYIGSTRNDTCKKIKDGFLTEVAEQFGWTEPQAYIATEFLFRPENNN
jgi:hypothetical protein